VALAHRDARGEHADAVVGGWIGVDEFLGPADRLSPGWSAPHRAGELALPARPAEEHHEPAGDGHGDVGAVVVLDEGQRDVDSGGDAGGRPHVAIARPDRVGVDAHRGEALGQLATARPVRRDRAAV
jgi:hypothetical protein